MRRALPVAATALAIAWLGTATGDAHKPITSPFTYHEHIVPIVRDHCVRCHAPGGAAPMSLATYESAVPWAQSIRAELMSGHMPPWSVDAAPGRFRNVAGISGRELNMLLTWAVGGTPAGPPPDVPAMVETPTTWTLGDPDLRLPLPDAILTEDEQEKMETFVVDPGVTTDRWVRAVDLLPGTPSIVRHATIRLDGPESDASLQPERVLALWVPGDRVVPADAGAGFLLPAGGRLRVTIRYRKTWEQERASLRDRSVVGLYWAANMSRDVNAFRVSTSAPLQIARRAQALAVYPGDTLVDVGVIVTAIRPDRSTVELVAFRPRRDWARRYWFTDPIELPAGTRIEMRTTPIARALLPPDAAPPPVAPPADGSMTINVLE